MQRFAHISKCGKYRYYLRRTWATETFVSTFEGGTLLWIMHNPSTADGEEDDPTVRRCISFSKREGYGELRVVNLYAYRATLFADVFRGTEFKERVGPKNDQAILLHARCADKIILAWGSREGTPPKPEDYFRDLRVIELLRPQHDRLYCLGINKNDTPKHPLYIKGDTPFQEYFEAMNLQSPGYRRKLGLDPYPKGGPYERPSK